jgi:tetratricopeptide (TPR) repeat protein
VAIGRAYFTRAGVDPRSMPARSPAPPAPAQISTGSFRESRLAICLGLIALVWAVFGGTLGYQFVNLDDNENVYENPVVSRGLNAGNVVWAFTHTQVSRWVPLSTLAHMLDCELYGLSPRGHHATCVLLHTAATVFLFLFLFEATGARWRSAFVAALFAIHPLRVEAVAWVSTLQYNLSGLCFMLTLWAYVHYARARSLARYAIVAGLFVLGLLAKEMLVTLPAVLLLLDFWPLRRSTLSPAGSSVRPSDASPAQSVSALVAEKLPLFSLSIVWCVIALVALRSFQKPVVTYSWAERLGNALTSYAAYLGQTFFPVGLTPWYPHPGAELSWPEVAFAALLLAAVSALVAKAWRSQPYLLTGWLWFLGMLVPVIGLVQRGEQARCDRYTYLSQIGLVIMIAWGVTEVTARWRRQRLILATIAAVIVTLLAFTARAQSAHWRNSEALWRHTLAHTSRNYVAHNNLAIQLAQSDRIAEALGHFEQAMRARPTSAEAQNNYGYTLALLKRFDEAIPFYENAIRLKPDFVNAHLNLGDALVALGREAEAKVHFANGARIEAAGKESGR